MRYIPKRFETMPAGMWAVWDTQIDNWYIWQGYPAIRQNGYATVSVWCKTLN